LRTALFCMIVAVVGLTALSEIGVNVAPLLAGAGIVGIAIGFGSQKLVQDLITGLFLLIENTVQVGDTVTVSGLSGVVENVSI
ncbi:mechanosensitive ion channel domain-containing protein, partial [Klebsiella pneumoniae]